MISTQVARLLGVLAAETRLCVRHGRRGSVSRSVVPDGWSLIDGSTWLQASPDVEGYIPHTSRGSRLCLLLILGCVDRATT